MTKVYQAVTQEERHRNMIRGREERTQVMAHATRTGDGRDEKLKCTFCHKTGHEVDNCFKKTGRYPEWWYDNPGRGRGIGRGKEHSGPGRGRGKAVAHAVIGEASEEKHGEGVIQNKVAGLSDEQWKVLLQLVENSKAACSGEKLSGMPYELGWLLDSGASYHMTARADLFYKIDKLNPIPVTMPDGKITYATCVGEIHMSPKIHIKNVLLVPGWNCNLISVARLIDDIKCEIYFANDICVIQDQPSRMPIGVAKRKGGVYYFHFLDRIQAHSIKGVHSGDLCHSRLGHPSKTVLRLVSDLNHSLFQVDLNNVCDACLRGKQTRDSFNNNLAKAVEPFELIHYDIW
ncbi:unnamed protein product, partial [Cuscuta europaea]